jgi:hypothetical protein
MPPFFDPTPDQRRELEELAAEVPDIQQTLIRNSDQLTQPDRGAHQQQIAGGRVLLQIERELPAELQGLGVFDPAAAPPSGFVGIGRVSTGLGCPHAETAPDFLGLMLAFQTAAGRRIDFVTINDPTAPTNTPEEFIALLKATADSARTGSQALLLLSLTRHAGLRGPVIATHILGQTSRTVRSSSAYQPYWTGVVRARDTLGKFTFIPVDDVNTRRGVDASGHYLTDDWRLRQSRGPLAFGVYWIPFQSERETPLDPLTRAWDEDRRVRVGTVTFPQIDPSSRDAKLAALLAAEMGANPGHWVEQIGDTGASLPATRFTASRALVYRTSQRERGALEDADYASFFARGDISETLAAELVRRHRSKQSAQHWTPDLGNV